MQAWVVGRVVNKLRERGAAICGLLFGALGYALIGFAATPHILFLAIPCLAMSGLARPSMQSLMTQCLGSAAQGRLQGAVASVTSLAGVFGPLPFATVFALSIGLFPGHAGMAFFSAAALLALSAILLFSLKQLTDMRVTVSGKDVQ